MNFWRSVIGQHLPACLFARLLVSATGGAGSRPPASPQMFSKVAVAVLFFVTLLPKRFVKKTPPRRAWGHRVCRRKFPLRLQPWFPWLFSPHRAPLCAFNPAGEQPWPCCAARLQENQCWEPSVLSAEVSTGHPLARGEEEESLPAHTARKRKAPGPPQASSSATSLSGQAPLPRAYC